MTAPSATAIVGDITKYIGTKYVFGGSNPTDGWDCSSCVNWVLGHDFHMKLPGSLKPGFAGTSHGPAVINYVGWRGARTVLKPQAGDLCIWVGVGAGGHIGIATSPSHMISALNPGLGTIASAIEGTGPPGAPLMFRRIIGQGSLVSTSGKGCLSLGIG